jgi:polyhydroxyalkanoate synthesis regulator phasin
MNPTEKVLDSSKRLVATGKSLLLAGVGAVAEAREGSAGMFDRLVERGKPLEAKRKQATGAVVERVTKAARGAGRLVQDTVEFESRGLLKRINVMTHEDVKVLSARISTLSKKIDEVVARRQAPPVAASETVTAVAAGAQKPAAPRQRKTTNER